MNRPSAAILSCLLISLLTAACSVGPAASPSAASRADWPPNKTYPLIPVPVGSEYAVGPNRLLVNLIDAQTNGSVARPELPVQFRLYDLATDTVNPAVTVDAVYMTTIAQLPGLYRATVTLPQAGEWGLEAIENPGKPESLDGRFIFDVRPTSSTFAIGAAVKPEDTPTATDAAGIAAISTDTNPDPDFYKSSISAALAAHEPFVVVFATPLFCKSATCGPTLDVVKSVAANYKGRLTFIHVEPYELTLTDGHLQPVLDGNNNPIPVQSVNDWGLPTEPYIFVVDGSGKLSAKFEGISGADELGAAFDAVLAGG